MIPVAFLLLIVWLAVLGLWLLEYHRLSVLRQSIPIRIGVTGTRGKSSLVRMLAGAFRANGMAVFAKTSGSRACMILPDGSEVAVHRNGLPSILEQKRILSLAAKSGCTVLVCEIMSIRPEYQEIESRQILGLTHCVVTNCRIDHPEHGTSKDSVARCFSTSVPVHGTVFCPEKELRPVLVRSAEALSSELVAVDSSDLGKDSMSAIEVGRVDHVELGENGALARGVCEAFGLDDRLSFSGMMAATGDVGALRAWDVDGVVCVSAFAANDIESTRLLLDRIPAGRRIGLLNLRADRPERTRQYIDAVLKGVFKDVEMFFCVGAHARLFRRKVGSVCPVIPVPNKLEGSAILAYIRRRIGCDGGAFQLVGMGNIAGKPKELIACWENHGVRHEF
jgi:poly-gamma-glutamate synthase PgsB/CapB